MYTIILPRAFWYLPLRTLPVLFLFFRGFWLSRVFDATLRFYYVYYYYTSRFLVLAAPDPT